MTETREATKDEFLAAMEEAYRQPGCTIEKDMDEVLVGGIIAMHNRRDGHIRIKRANGSVMAWQRLP